MQRQNILAEVSEMSSSALYRDMNFIWGKRSNTECCSSKERTGMAWLLAGVSKLKLLPSFRTRNRT
jgi:hypothetical protein